MFAVKAGMAMKRRRVMKQLRLGKVEQQALREMEILHGHCRTRMRAQAILRLGQRLTLQETADEFIVHINSVGQWRQRRNRLCLAGLYEGRLSGRRTKWSPAQREAFAKLAQTEGGSTGSLLRQVKQSDGDPGISVATAKRYLNDAEKRIKISLG